jgi:hypothetical protein
MAFKSSPTSVFSLSGYVYSAFHTISVNSPRLDCSTLRLDARREVLYFKTRNTRPVSFSALEEREKNTQMHSAWEVVAAQVTARLQPHPFKTNSN